MRHCVPLGVLLAGSLLVGGCARYGDETDAGRQSPPLVQIKAVNAWLAARKEQSGAVPQTYEALVSAYEQSGGRWPPFPEGGSWVYFPHLARVIEVRESWVRSYLRYINKSLEVSRFQHSADSARLHIERELGTPVDVPGYELEYRYRGRGSYFDIRCEADGVTAIRGNHTATTDFDIDATNRMIVLKKAPARPGRGG